MEEPRGAARYSLRSPEDLLVVLEAAKSLARACGLPQRAALELELTLREVGTNALRHGGGGGVELRRVQSEGGDDRWGIEAVVADRGPGIACLEAAFREGYSTGGGLGLGLPAARRLSDALEIETAPDKGTRVTIRKWGR